MITRLLSASTYQPEHTMWGVSRVALLAAAALLPVMIFAPGLVFWIDLLTVIPIMLMGGMCSEDMMTRMISTGVTFGLLAACLALAHVLIVRLRFAFENSQLSFLQRVWTRPGPTRWQARLFDVKLKRSVTRCAAPTLFARLDSKAQQA
ncbi:MAG: hypothetical protein AAF340_11945 [Pseudomonadota bacterium]